jgi:hypothetical protein
MTSTNDIPGITVQMNNKDICEYRNGEYQDLHDYARAKGRACDACEIIITIDPEETMREFAQICRAEAKMNR